MNCEHVDVFNIMNRKHIGVFNNMNCEHVGVFNIFQTICTFTRVITYVLSFARYIQLSYIKLTPLIHYQSFSGLYRQGWRQIHNNCLHVRFTGNASEVLNNKTTMVSVRYSAKILTLPTSICSIILRSGSDLMLGTREVQPYHSRCNCLPRMYNVRFQYDIIKKTLTLYRDSHDSQETVTPR